MLVNSGALCCLMSWADEGVSKLVIEVIKSINLVTRLHCFFSNHLLFGDQHFAAIKIKGVVS